MPLGRAKEDYVARNEKELTVMNGESLEIESSRGSEWWVVTDSRGRTGYVPSDIIESYDDPDDRGRSRSRHRDSDTRSMVYSIVPPRRYKSADRLGSRDRAARVAYQETYDTRGSVAGGHSYAAGSLASPARGYYSTQPGSTSLGATSPYGQTSYPTAYSTVGGMSTAGHQLASPLSASANPFMRSSALGTPGMTMGTPGMTMGTPGMTMGTPGMTMGTPGMTMGTPGMTMGTPGMTLGTPTMGFPTGGTPRLALPGVPAAPFPSTAMPMPMPGVSGFGTPTPGVPGFGTPTPGMPGFGTPTRGVPGFGTPAPAVPGFGTFGGMPGAPSTVGATRGFKMF